MKLPAELGSLQDLKKREANAFKRSTHWHDQLDDAYEYFLPNRNLFETTMAGQKKMDKIFDSTALEAIQQGASKLQENIAPIWSRWATFEPSLRVKKLLQSGNFDVSEEDIRRNLEEQAEEVFDYINRSNFATQFYEHALDLLIGTGTLRIDEDEDDQDNEKYWFTKDKINKISSVHNYLDSLPQIGKVLSFSSIIDVATMLNNNKPLGTLEMGVLYSKIPESIKTEIIDPYISIENNEARVNLRIIDSRKDLRRNDLIKKINYDLKNKIGLNEDEFKLAGVLILFNNLLQSLFKSQILTLGLVMIGIFSMFIILFRNIKLSLIGVVPNFIAAFFILGIIGLLGIPLDMMTITIAAITIGIAVDNSIHYIYRFKEEFNNIKDYNKTLKLCHSTVGKAILNTSITIVFGFSILVLSKFIPTIYFGIFTGLAMMLAMISVLTLLPALILLIKPFGK